MLSMLQPELCSSCAQLLGQVLGGTMLLSIEVAVEYWLALTWCPQAQWLNDAAQKGQLQDTLGPNRSSDSQPLDAGKC